MWWVAAIMVWILTAWYCVWRTRKELPEIEEEWVRNDAFFNAIGQIPQPVKNVGYAATIAFAPLLFIPYVLDHWREYKTKRKMRVLLGNIKRTISGLKAEKPEDQAEIDASKAKLSEIIDGIEKLLQEEEDRI